MRTQPKIELNADGNAASTDIFRPSIIDAYTSPPNNTSTGDVISNDGSARARLEYLSLMSEDNVVRGRSLVMVGNTHACMESTGSDANRGCTLHSTRPWMLTTGTPDKPLIGAVQRERLRPKRSAHALVTALIWDAQSINARIVCHDPERSRICTNAVPKIIDDACCGGGHGADTHNDASATGAVF